MSLFKLKINLFGELWRLHQITCSTAQEEQWRIIAHRLKTPLHKALTDPYFYYLLQDGKIKTVDDLNGCVWEGLLNSQKNQIEI